MARMQPRDKQWDRRTARCPTCPGETAQHADTVFRSMDDRIVMAWACSTCGTIIKSRSAEALAARRALTAEPLDPAGRLREWRMERLRDTDPRHGPVVIPGVV